MKYHLWDECATNYGVELINDLRKVIFQRGGKSMQAGLSLGPRSYLTWLAPREDQISKMAKRVLTNRDGLDEDTALQALRQSAKTWQRYLNDEAPIGGNTEADYVRKFSAALTDLNKLDPKKYLAIPRGFLITSDHPAVTPSLGTNDWPELAGLIGLPRERKALSITVDEAATIFAELERLFLFGYDVLTASKAPENSDASAWAILKTRLKMERNFSSYIQSTGTTYTPPDKRVANTNVWRDAGLESPLLPKGVMNGAYSSKFLRYCVAPSMAMNHAVGQVYCGATGWNKQPTFCLPPYPFAYTSSDVTGLMSEEFFVEFKNRARRDVIGRLEIGPKISEAELEYLRGECQRVASEAGFGNEESFIELRNDSLASDILKRYERISSLVRDMDTRNYCANRLFIYHNGDSLRPASETPKTIEGTGFFRKGIDYRKLRRTTLTLKLREVGSVEALAVWASHSDSKTLMPHYLNRDEATGDFEANIRLEQNLVMAVVLENSEKARIVIELTPQEFEHYWRLATVSGLRAVLMPESLPPAASPLEKITILPTPDNLLSVYLLHFALMKNRFTCNSPTRWQIQGRPLLIQVRGIRRALRAAGLEEAYQVEAKKGFKGLKAGTLALPNIMGF